MSVRIGNAGAPRWYDLSPTRLDAYLGRLVEWGATSGEVVLHHGPADERIARVHVLNDDWLPVFEQYRRHGLICHVHAPLHPRFKLDRWASERAALQAEWAPVLDALAEFGERQSEPPVLVVHGASRHRAASGDFLAWVLREMERRGSAGRIAVELRRPLTAHDTGFDRSREAISTFVAELGLRQVGVCWDIGHDWEGSVQHGASFEPPNSRFLEQVSHVHLHDAGGELNDVHYPLQSERIDWRPQVARLLAEGYRGAISLEVRYRFAQSMGEPWDVLGGSYALARGFLDAHPSEAREHADATAGHADDLT